MGKILVVDDEPLICEMLDVFLSRAGHDVCTASNGEEATKVVKKTEIDLVITDIVMPERDGIETIIQLRKDYPDLSIIAISGGPRVGNCDFLAMAGKLGACETLHKPLDSDQLLLAVEKCLAKGCQEQSPNGL